jgi:hypothetical protein
LLPSKLGNNIPTESIQTLGKAFRRLPECGITETMLEVLDGMEAISTPIDHYLQGTLGGLTLGQIVRTRTGIQKRLLVLPTVEELNINITASFCPNLYECCRLTALVFSIAVIYPLLNTYDVLQILVRQLKASLKAIDIESLSVDYSEVLGGIAASGKPERPWFVSNLALVDMKILKLDWESVEDILKSFLWLKSACNPGGRRL